MGFGRCKFEIADLVSGVHSDPYLSNVYDFLQRFQGQEFANASVFFRELSGWKEYCSRMRVPPNSTGPFYDHRNGEVFADSSLGKVLFGYVRLIEDHPSTFDIHNP